MPEQEWTSLLENLNDQNLVPIVGPGLVTVPDEASGHPIPLTRALATKLARELDLAEPEKFMSLNEVAAAHLLHGKNIRWDSHTRAHVCGKVREIYKRMSPVPSPELLTLASITDFKLLISGTSDPLFSHALERNRPDFDPTTRVRRFHPKTPRDLPDNFNDSAEPLLYHILGDYVSQPDYAVWEEDYMEYICSLIEHQKNAMSNFFSTVKNKNLLLLGAPCTDWIVRFFLRVARQERLSECTKVATSYLADKHENLGDPMVFFFDKMIGSTHIINGSPGECVTELAQRWKDSCLQVRSEEDFLERLPKFMPSANVFISYSRDDWPSVSRFARGLAAARIPVWLDKQRLLAGANYENHLEEAVKDCSFFISLISRATESDPSRYVHKERAWAASRHGGNCVFYLPVVIDGTATCDLEPDCYKFVQRTYLPGGEIDQKFKNRLHELLGYLRNYGRPLR